jgi:HNH endonuclease
MTQGVRSNPLWKLLLHPPVTDECIEWKHSRLPMPRPYGQVRYQGRNWLVHRLSYTLHIGCVPNELDVCHSCDNPPCWNPRHLFKGTRIDNMQDSKRKGRNFIPAGELGSRTVLTEAQVLEIRSLYRPHTRGLGYKSLAARFRVHPSTVASILYRRNWRHI